MSTLDATVDHWNALERLYREASDILSSVPELEAQARWTESIALCREAAIRFPLLANEISTLSASDVDPAVIAYATKTCQYMKHCEDLFDRFASYFAYKKDYTESFPTNEGLVASAIRFLLGMRMTSKQRAAKKRLDQMNNKLAETVTENGVERSVLNGDRDYLYKMLSEKYGMEFEH